MSAPQLKDINDMINAFESIRQQTERSKNNATEGKLLEELAKVNDNLNLVNSNLRAIQDNLTSIWMKL